MKKEFGKLILETQIGSHLYGVATENSDEDYKGVFLPNKQYLLGLQKVEEVADNVVSKVNGKNTKDAIDRTYVEIRNFIQQCSNGNPNFIEILFANKDNIVYIDEFGEKLIQNRQLFISKQIANRFFGFIISCERKMDTSYVNLNNLLNALKYLLNLDISIDKTDSLPKLEQYAEFVDIFKPDKYAYRIGAYSINKNCTINNAIKTLSDIVSTSTQRKENVKAIGYDFKAGYHILRLLTQLQQIFTNGTIQYPLPNAEYIKKVKSGLIPLQEFVEVKERMKIECKELEKKSNIPQKLDYEKINNLCEEILTNWVKELIRV